MKMAIRKMTKKDATTRLKAVQEFTEMCEGTFVDEQASAAASNEEVAKAAVKAVLPFWWDFNTFGLNLQTFQIQQNGFSNRFLFWSPVII